jgi:hypothetical protein
MQSKHRNTKRKALIAEILVEDYAGGPVLLEELRWNVLTKQYGPTFIEMTDAKRKSFARTVVSNCPNLARNVIRPSVATAGTIARAALYRIKSRETIDRFLASREKFLLLHIGYPDHGGFLRGEYGFRVYNAKRQRYRKRLPRVTIGCYFFDTDYHDALTFQSDFTEDAIASVIVPKSHRLVAIGLTSTLGLEKFPKIESLPCGHYYFNNDISGGAFTIEKVASNEPMPFQRKRR